MPLVYACIAPHGGELIPHLAGDKLGLFSRPRRGMRVLAAQMEACHPETIVIASPHNLRLLRHLGVVLSENCSGDVVEGNNRVSLKAECDVELGRKLLRACEVAHLPVVGANYGGLEGPSSDLPMDWGSLIPLWFFLGQKKKGRRILIITPSRGIPLRQNYEFGRILARICEDDRRRVAFVASADQAHAHLKEGPYGFAKEASDYDAKVVRAVKSGKLRSMMRVRPELVEAAKPDSLWQMVILAGVLEVVPLKGEVISYDLPTYFGMLCAGFRRSAKLE